MKADLEPVLQHPNETCSSCGTTSVRVTCCKCAAELYTHPDVECALIGPSPPGFKGYVCGIRCAYTLTDDDKARGWRRMTVADLPMLERALADAAERRRRNN